MKSVNTLARFLMDLTGGAALLLLLPVMPAFAFLVTQDRAYVSKYRSSILSHLEFVRAMVGREATSRLIADRLGNRKEKRESIQGSCIKCGRCCLDHRCLFLQAGPAETFRCKIHGSWLWRRLACSQYPSSAEAIALYQCPTYYVREEPTCRDEDLRNPGQLEVLVTQDAFEATGLMGNRVDRVDG